RAQLTGIVAILRFPLQIWKTLRCDDFLEKILETDESTHTYYVDERIATEPTW
ncbi:hypothetical protein Ancab_020792, partial [Ancistrocladus abbreviatus]